MHVQLVTDASCSALAEGKSTITAHVTHVTYHLDNFQTSFMD